MFINHPGELAARRVLRRHARTLIVAAAATMLIAAAPAGAAATCRDADLAPTVSDLPAYANATLCLINEQRAAAALPPLSRDAALNAASEAYAQLMVDESFFGHVAPDGASLTDRLAAANYLPRDSDWIIGENVAWAAEPVAAPRAINAAWMASPGHRANILARDFRQIGVGIAIGSPAATTGGVTVTTDFGALDPPPASHARCGVHAPHRARAHRRGRCGGRVRRPDGRAGGRVRRGAARSPRAG